MSRYRASSLQGEGVLIASLSSDAGELPVHQTMQMKLIETHKSPAVVVTRTFENEEYFVVITDITHEDDGHGMGTTYSNQTYAVMNKNVPEHIRKLRSVSWEVFTTIFSTFGGKDGWGLDGLDIAESKEVN